MLKLETAIVGVSAVLIIQLSEYTAYHNMVLAVAIATSLAFSYSTARQS